MNLNSLIKKLNEDDNYVNLLSRSEKNKEKLFRKYCKNNL